jgi:hypothetical protein
MTSKKQTKLVGITLAVVLLALVSATAIVPTAYAVQNQENSGNNGNLQSQTNTGNNALGQE